MTRRVVAFLDVLGFKQLVERVPHEDLIGLYRTLLEAGYAHTTVPSYPDDHRKWDEEPVYHDDEVKQRRFLSVMMASDSIVVFSDHERAMPLRGAIALGDLDIVDATDVAEPSERTATAVGLVGAGLVRAYNLESKFAWSVAVLDSHLVEHLENEVLTTAGDGGTLSAWDFIRSTQLVTYAEMPLKHVVSAAGRRLRTGVSRALA